MRSALQAQPDLAETQTSSGVLKFWLDWDWPGILAGYHQLAQVHEQRGDLDAA